MHTVSVSIDLPSDLLGTLDVPRASVERQLRELIAFELVREGRISTGKGADLLKMTKQEFVQLLATRGIDYFTETPDELTDQATALHTLLKPEPA